MSKAKRFWHGSYFGRLSKKRRLDPDLKRWLAANPLPTKSKKVQEATPEPEWWRGFVESK